MAEVGIMYMVKAECDVCTHHWFAWAPLGTDFDRLECPKCHAQSSTLITVEDDEYPESP